MGNYFNPAQQQPYGDSANQFGQTDQQLIQLIMDQLLTAAQPNQQIQAPSTTNGGNPGDPECTPGDPSCSPGYDCNHPPEGGWPGGYNPGCPINNENCPPGLVCGMIPTPDQCAANPNLEGCPDPDPGPIDPGPIDPTPDPPCPDGSPRPASGDCPHPPPPPPPDKCPDGTPRPPDGICRTTPGADCPPGYRPGPIPGTCFPETTPTPGDPVRPFSGGSLFPWFWFGGDRFQLGDSMDVGGGTQITPFHIPMPLERPQDFSGLNFDKWKLNMPDIPQLNLPSFGG